MQKNTVILIIMILSGVFVFAGCSQPIRDYSEAPPPELSTVMDLSGRWIDLDSAVAKAADETGLAVLSADRWNTMVQYQLVTETGQPASLVVIGIRQSESDTAESDAGNITNNNVKPGIRIAEARIGRLRNGAYELRFLEALKKHLNSA